MIKNKFEIKFFLLIFIAVISLVLGFSSISKFQSDNIFTLKKIEIKNVNYFPEEDISSKLQKYMNTDLNQISIDDIRNEIINIGWVKNIFIRKSFPDEIIIKIEEKIPFALWKNNNNSFLLDKDGNVINYPTTENLDKFIFIENKNPPSNLEIFFNKINTNKYIKSRIYSVKNISNRRWNLYIKSFGNKIEIKLPEMGVVETLEKLEKLDKEKDLLKRNFNIIDARNEEWLIR